MYVTTTFALVSASLTSSLGLFTKRKTLPSLIICAYNFYFYFLGTPQLQPLSRFSIRALPQRAGNDGMKECLRAFRNFRLLQLRDDMLLKVTLPILYTTLCSTHTAALHTVYD
jgi:hypothetical protein